MTAKIHDETTATKYYFFNGLRGPGYLHYLHAVHKVGAKRHHLGSTVSTTYSSNGTRASERGYYAFGSERRADGPHLATDYRFTGQKVGQCLTPPLAESASPARRQCSR